MEMLAITQPLQVPGIGAVGPDSGMVQLAIGGAGLFKVGHNGVKHILLPADKKVEFIVYDDTTLAYVRSALGHPAIYPLESARIVKPVKAMLMDLDGTSVHSEHFWIWIIQLSIASLMGNPKFELEDADLPFVSGHSVSEHLKHCITKYCPDKPLAKAREYYFEHTEREMQAILDGHGQANAFTPAPGLKEFLYALKAKDIKIGLVTSGLYQKAWPEILSAFKTLNMGDPAEFYDAIITAGFQVGRKGSPGTLGELSPKPHPWLYAETAAVGLGLSPSDRPSVVGLEDSGAGVVSIRLAGYACIGLTGGNIVASGTRCLLQDYCEGLEDVLKVIS